MDDDYTIDQIHANLDRIETALSILRSRAVRKIDAYDIAPLHDLLVDMTSGFTSEASNIAAALRLPAVPLRQILKFEDGIDRRTAQAIAERLRTYFRMLESNHSTSSVDMPVMDDVGGGSEESAREAAADLKEEQLPSRVKPAVFAEGWFIVHSNSSTQSKIATISDLLSIIVANVERSNLPEQDQILNSIEKKQLITILETALEVLKAPMVEVGLLRRTRDWLIDVAQRSAKEQAQEVVGQAMTQAREMLESLFQDWNILP